MFARAHHATLDDVDVNNVHDLEHALGEVPMVRRVRAFPHIPTRRQPVKNVKMSVKGNVLTITVDLAAKRDDSRSGKTEIIASTQGNVLVPGTKASDEIKLGLNVYASK